MTDRPCAFPDCGKPLVRREADPLEGREGESLAHFEARETCGYQCGQGLRLWRKRNGWPGGRERDRVIENDHSAAYWPKVTGEFDWANAFAKHNVRTNDGGVFRMPKPLNHSPTGSAAAWAVEAGR